MKELSSSKRGDPMHDLLETFRQRLELENMVNQIQHSSGQIPATSSMLQSISLMPQHQLPTLLSFLVSNILNNNKIIGFRGRICYNCFDYWVDPLYGNSKEMKSLIKSAKPSPHTCNPKKVSDAQKNVQGIQDTESNKKNELQNELINLILSMIIICWSYFGESKIYLRTEELKSSTSLAFDTTQPQNNNTYLPQVEDVGSRSIEKELPQQQEQQKPPLLVWIEEQEEIENNCNSIDIDLAKVEQNHWAYRAIKQAIHDGKSSIVVDSSELIDFVKGAKATFGTRAVDVGESIRTFCMYLYLPIS